MKMKNKLFLGLGILGIAAAGTVFSVTESNALKADAAEGESYVKVTEALDDWTGTYLIVCESENLAFDGSLAKLDAVNDYKTVAISEGSIEATAAMDAISFSIAKDSDGKSYNILSASGNYIGQTSDSNGLSSSSSRKYPNTISYDDGNIDIVSGGAYLRFNSTSNQMRFRYYKSSSYTNQEAIQLYKLTYTGEAILPNSVEIKTDETTISKIGGTLQLSASVLPEEATNKAVIWSSSNKEVATVDGSGLVTANIKEGETVITATSAADSNLKDEITITVDFPEAVASSNDAFLLEADFPETNSSKPNYAELSNGIVVEHQAAFKSEYYGKPQITIYSDPGYIANVFALEPISKIILIPASNPQYCNVEVYSGTTYEDNKNTKIDPKTLETEDGTTYWEYTFAEGQTFFNIFNNTGHAQYLKNIIVEFGGEDASAAHAWAQGFLDTTAEECAALDVKKDTWTDLAASYNKLSSGAKDIIKADYPEIDGELYTTIQKAIERYSYIVGKYDYENFINIDLSAYVAPLSMPGEADSTFYIALGSILGAAVLAIAAAVIIKKRGAKASK